MNSGQREVTIYSIVVLAGPRRSIEPKAFGASLPWSEPPKSGPGQKVGGRDGMAFEPASRKEGEYDVHERAMRKLSLAIDSMRLNMLY